MSIMTPVKSWLSENLPLKTSAFGKFLFFLQFFYLYQVFVTDDTGGFSFRLGDLSAVFFSLFSVYWFFQWLAACFSHTKRGVAVVTFTGLIAYCLLAAYHFGAQELFDFSVLIDNIGIAFSENALGVMMANLEMDALLYLMLFALIFLVLELVKGTVSKARQDGPLRPKILFGGALYLLMIFNPFDSYDPFINFFRSVHHHYSSPIRLTEAELQQSLRQSGEAFQHINVLGDEERPHVFLIIIESLNANKLNQKTESGQLVLPTLTALQEQSVFVPQFYGNSIQTAKGHFATLFGVIPSITGKTYVRFEDLEIPSIASAMKTGGYETTYFSAYKSRRFDNTYNFISPRGFDNFEVIRPHLTEEELANKFAWGVEDSVFYRRFFKVLDEKGTLTSGAPQFLTVTTIANHFPFNSVPEDRQLLHSNPDGIGQDYENSVYLTDLGIKTFFEELEARGLAEKSIVIITGDHAFPMGEHGNFHLEAGYHEESFRVPFFLVWKGKLAPQKMTKSFSQMDIGPTLFDLCEIPLSDSETYQGRSVFDQGPQHPLFLIQPYGKHLSVVRYPIKFRFHTKTNQFFAYNLEVDPMEEVNIFSTLSDAEKEQFYADLRTIYLNHSKIKSNRL